MSSYRPYPTHPEDDPNYGNVRYGFGSSMPIGVAFVLWVLIYWGLGVVVQAFSHGNPLDAAYLVLRGIIAVFLGGALTAGNVNRRRKAGGIEAIRTMRAAIRSAVLPANADARVWQPALEYRERQLLRGRWLNPLLLALFAALAIAAALASADPRALLLSLGLAAFCAAGIVWEELRIARELPRTRTLLQHLKTLTTAA